MVFELQGGGLGAVLEEGEDALDKALRAEAKVLREGAVKGVESPGKVHDAPGHQQRGTHLLLQRRKAAQIGRRAHVRDQQLQIAPIARAHRRVGLEQTRQRIVGRPTPHVASGKVCVTQTADSKRQIEIFAKIDPLGGGLVLVQVPVVPVPKAFFFENKNHSCVFSFYRPNFQS